MRKLRAQLKTTELLLIDDLFLRKLPASAGDELADVLNPPDLHYSSRFTALYVHLPQRGGEVRSLVHYAGVHAPALGMTFVGGELEVRISTSMLVKISNMLN